MHWKLFVFSVALLAHYAEADVKVICYYGSWASYNGINPEDFDANLCTHVNYAFIGLWDDGNVRVEDDALDIGQKLFTRVTDMKKKNPNLKVLLSVGGAAAGSAQLFAGMAANSGKRGAFVGSASYFISTYHFDGLDIDWEVPNGGDRGNFITLLQQLRTEFNKHGWLLTAAVSANPADGYDVKQMNGLLDWFNVMTYDMYGSWSQYTGQTSPLFASHVESDWEQHNLNIAACASNWVNAGASKSKIALGVAFYGRSFTLANPSQHGIHAPIKGVGVHNGELSYLNICSEYYAWTRIWDNEQRNPYKYSGDQWFGYDDGDSIWIKTDYVKDNGFFGVMIWAIDLDDVKGRCGLSQNLLKHVNGALGKIDCC